MGVASEAGWDMLTCGLSWLPLQWPENKTEELEKNSSLSGRRQHFLSHNNLSLCLTRLLLYLHKYDCRSSASSCAAMEPGHTWSCQSQHPEGSLQRPPEGRQEKRRPPGGRQEKRRGEERRQKPYSRPHSSTAEGLQRSFQRADSWTAHPQSQHQRMRHVNPGTHQGPAASRADPERTHSTFSFQMSSNTEVSVKDGRNQRRGAPKRRSRRRRVDTCAASSACPSDRTASRPSPGTCSSAGTQAQLQTLQLCKRSWNSNNWSCWRGQSSQCEGIKAWQKPSKPIKPQPERGRSPTLEKLFTILGATMVRMASSDSASWIMNGLHLLWEDYSIQPQGWSCCTHLEPTCFSTGATPTVNVVEHFLQLSKAVQ